MCKYACAYTCMHECRLYMYVRVSAGMSVCVLCMFVCSNVCQACLANKTRNELKHSVLQMSIDKTQADRDKEIERTFLQPKELHALKRITLNCYKDFHQQNTRATRRDG